MRSSPDSWYNKALLPQPSPTTLSLTHLTHNQHSPESLFILFISIFQFSSSHIFTQPHSIERSVCSRESASRQPSLSSQLASTLPDIPFSTHTPPLVRRSSSPTQYSCIIRIGILRHETLNRPFLDTPRRPPRAPPISETKFLAFQLTALASLFSGASRSGIDS